MFLEVNNRKCKQGPVSMVVSFSPAVVSHWCRCRIGGGLYSLRIELLARIIQWREKRQGNWESA